MLEKTNDAVNFFESFSSRADDDGEIVFGNLFEKGPVGHVAAWHLHEIEAVVDDLRDRDLIPGSTHGEKACFDNSVFDLSILIPGKVGFGKAFYIFEIVTALVRRMDTSVDI